MALEAAESVPSSAFTRQHQGLTKFLYEEKERGNALKSKLHKHQIDAVLAAKAQLDPDTKQPNIALVVLPTGCGKTGVAVLAPYVLKAARVLVVTPSKTISKQIHEAFCGSANGESMFLLDTGVYDQKQKLKILPPCAFIKATAEIKQSLTHDLMIITAHQVGSKSKVGIEDLPSEGYDLVIVDEAHHYPAPTWKKLVDHFPKSKRLFLTATPYHKGEPILQHKPCYELARPDAVERGIIRNVKFVEIPGDTVDENTAMQDTAQKIMEILEQHDADDSGTFHQAMVQAQEVRAGGINPAETFCSSYNALARVKYPPAEIEKNQCEKYVGDTSPFVVKHFKEGKIRTLVIVGKLLEGFDHKNISVVGIVRNVAKESRVMFAQFVGRAVRKVSNDDPVTAMVVSHARYKQQENFDQFDKIPDEDICIND